MNRSQSSLGLRSTAPPFQPRFRRPPSQSSLPDHPLANHAVYDTIDNLASSSTTNGYVLHPNTQDPQSQSNQRPRATYPVQVHEMSISAASGAQPRALMFGSLPVAMPQGLASVMQPHFPWVNPVSSGQQRQHAYEAVAGNNSVNKSGQDPSCQGSLMSGCTSHSSGLSHPTSVGGASFFPQASTLLQSVWTDTPPMPQPCHADHAPQIHDLLLYTCSDAGALRWNVTQDPFTGSYFGRRVSHEAHRNSAFNPGLSDILILFAFQSSEERGFASLEPEEGQRIYAFVISTIPDRVSLAGLCEQEVRTMESESESNAESKSDNHYLGLDVLGVLSGIRRGLQEPLPQDFWSLLTLRQKFVLVHRLSKRRPSWDKLDRVNGEIVQFALKLEPQLTTLSANGKYDALEQAKGAISEAHRILDAYAFGQLQVRRDPLKAADLLGGKTEFKGLRWMDWRPVGGTEAFFMCVA